MGKYKIYLGITVCELVLLAALFLLSHQFSHTEYQLQLDNKRQVVRLLGLTDLSIWTEARYTRHPSQTDFFTPFQDFPSSLEHFPAGSIVVPPQLNPDQKMQPETRKEKKK